MDSAIINQEIEKILSKVADNLNIRTYELSYNSESKKGDGFLGEFFSGKIINKENGKSINLAIKKVFINKNYKDLRMDAAYKNENYFYSNIFPAMDKFQISEGKSSIFNAIPKYFLGVDDFENEAVVMENIQFQGYVMRDKRLLLDDKHAKLIFNTYGKFHALSFAFKHQRPEEFEKLSNGITDYFEILCHLPKFMGALEGSFKASVGTLDRDEYSAVIECCQKYINNFVETFQNVSKCDQEYSGIIHGDCWSNNMMFIYEGTEVKDMCLLDFQLVRYGSPVYDLSYFFYTGGSKELFDNLNIYLKIYHDSFSSSLKQLGGDPDKLLPFEVLVDHWKKYAKFGIVMSMMLAKIKLLEHQEVNKLTHSVSDSPEEKGRFQKMKYDKETFNKRVREVLLHGYEIGCL